MTFKVDRMAAVDQQLQELGKRAKARRIGEAYIDALQTMMNNLANRPLEWGDPEYHTKLPGGLVCHGLAWPLCVRFAVYEALQVVIILNIEPFPRSPLADL
jgi:hypothetical protein